MEREPEKQYPPRRNQNAPGDIYILPSQSTFPPGGREKRSCEGRSVKKRYWNTRDKDADTEGAGAPSLHQSRDPCAAPCRGLPAESGRLAAVFRLLSISAGEVELPLRWLPPATPLWTYRTGAPCAASCSRAVSFTIGRYTFLRR